MQTFKLLTGSENVNHDMCYSHYKQSFFAKCRSLCRKHDAPVRDRVRYTRYEVVVRVGSILFGKISSHPWCTGVPILDYSSE